MSRRHTALALLTLAASVALLGSAAAAQDAPTWRVSAAESASRLMTTASGARVDTGLTGFAFETAIDKAHPLNGRLTGEVSHPYVAEDATQVGTIAQRFGGDHQPSAVTIGLRYRFGR